MSLEYNPIMEQSEVTEKITAVVIVLNNAIGLKRCLDSLISAHIRKIIVVDGGSTDGSTEVALAYTFIKLYKIGRTGLAHSRQFGIEEVATEYVLLADTDNVFTQDTPKKMLNYIQIYNFAGVAAGKISFLKNNIFGNFQEWLNNHGVNKPGKKLVIGTPSLYKTEILKSIKFDSTATLGDDTDLCYRLSINGYSVGTSDAVVEEEMPGDLTTFCSKAYLYGKSDGQFFMMHPARRHSISTHVVRNYLIKMIYISLKEMEIKKIPLIFLYTSLRLSGMINVVAKSSIECIRK